MAEGMRVTATSNIKDVLADIDRFGRAIQDVALTRAVNRLAEQAETAGLREMSRIYRIPQKRFEKYMSMTEARYGAFVASINAKGKGMPLYLFNPHVVRGKNGGVRVTIKGRSYLIPHAFLATVRSPGQEGQGGHTGVFARGGYGGRAKRFKATGQSFGRFLFSSTRLSINELFTFSAPGAFSNPEVVDAMNKRVEEQAEKVIAQEINFATRR